MKCQLVTAALALLAAGCIGPARPDAPPGGPVALMQGPDESEASRLAGTWVPYSPDPKVRWPWRFRLEVRGGEVRCIAVYHERTPEFAKGEERPSPCFRFTVDGLGVRGVDRFNDPVDGVIRGDFAEIRLRVRSRLPLEVRENVYTYRRAAP